MTANPTIDEYSAEERAELLEGIEHEFVDSLPEDYDDSTPLENAVMLLLDLAQSHEKTIAELKAQICGSGDKTLWDRVDELQQLIRDVGQVAESAARKARLATAVYG